MTPFPAANVQRNNIDLSEVEVRFMALAEPSPVKAEIDLHVAAAAKMFGIPESMVTQEQRLAGKRANFLAAYTPPSFSEPVRPFQQHVFWVPVSSPRLQFWITVRDAVSPVHRHFEKVCVWHTWQAHRGNEGLTWWQLKIASGVEMRLRRLYSFCHGKVSQQQRILQKLHQIR